MISAPNLQNESELTSLPIPEQENSCQCPFCPSVIKLNKNMKRHINDYHGILSPDGKSFYRRRIRCKNCKIICLNESNYETQHKLKHQNLSKMFESFDQTSNDRKSWK